MVKIMKAMKHILPLILMVCLSSAVHAQKDVPSTAKVTASAAETDSPLKAKAHELDSVAMRLFLEKDFLKSTEVRQQHLDVLRQLYGETDSTYIQALVQLAKCYYRTERLPKAVEAAQRIVDLYGQNHSTTDRSYAFYLDNLALYQAANHQNEDALANSMKALDVYDKAGLHDVDLSIILMHVAENLHDQGRSEEAIRHELRALNIMRNEYGEHSEEYLNELPYLKAYYEKAGQTDKAKKLQERITKLKEEAEKGIADLPEPVDFTSAELCHEHNADMLKYCNYYFNHYFSAPQMMQAINYIMQWTTVSDDVHILVGEGETKLLATPETMPYGVGYMAGCAQYALETDSADFSYEMYEYAMITMLNHYIANKELTGEVAYLEKYIKAHEKSYDALIAMIRKSYDKILADQEKGKFIKTE